jgi:mRNA interferase RelE/StbE
MASYKILFRTSAYRKLKKFDLPLIKRISDKIDSLAENPFPQGVEQLAVYTNPTIYRVRVGDYRILYNVDTKINTITIAAIGHRRDIYR